MCVWRSQSFNVREEPFASRPNAARVVKDILLRVGTNIVGIVDRALQEITATISIQKGAMMNIKADINSCVYSDKSGDQAVVVLRLYAPEKTALMFQQKINKILLSINGPVIVFKDIINPPEGQK